MDIIKAHAVKNSCYITARKMTPAGIVVHSTGANNPNLKRYVDCPELVGENIYGNHWNTKNPGGRQVCVHAFIGYDINNNVRVAEILPLDICCWGVGSGKKGSYNFSPSYIQFEICEDNLQDINYYHKAFSVAAEYVAHLCNQYNISVKNVVSHREAYLKGYGCNHGDPEHWMKNFDETMDDFRKNVSEILEKEYKKCANDDISTKTDDIIKTVSDGDLVIISENATYYSGGIIPDWVKKDKWYVRGTQAGSRVIIDKNESGTNSICSPIDVKYLKVVKAATNNNTSFIHKASTLPYCVKTTGTPIIIRKDAGGNTPTTGCITGIGVYTIVDEKDGEGASKWGKLKSGAGWISLDCVQKI